MDVLIINNYKGEILSIDQTYQITMMHKFSLKSQLCLNKTEIEKICSATLKMHPTVRRNLPFRY